MIRALLLCLGLMLPSVAQAQLAAGGLDLHLFRPAVDSKGLLSVDGVDVLGHLDVSFGLVLDGGFGLVPVDVFESSADTPADRAVRHRRLVDRVLTGTLHGNLGLANRLVVGLQLPVLVVSGPNATIPAEYNVRGRGLDFQGLGNLTIHGKLRLLRPERSPIGLAALLHVELPTGDSSHFAGDPGVTLWPTLAIEWRPHQRFRMAANVGYRAVLGEGATLRVGARTTPGATNATGAVLDPSAGADLRWDDQISFGLGASVRAADSVDLVAEAYGGQTIHLGEPHSLGIEALLGLKVFVDGRSYLTIAGGLGLTDGVQAADVRGVVGFVFEPSIGDRDGDGFKDDVDTCPDEPEDFDDFADADGCADLDDDRDGHLDEDDDCRLIPEDRDGDADDDGCPEGNEGDRDGDGHLDDADECPDDPEDHDGFQDDDECPDPDNDADRILDPDDLCPDDPEDIDDFQDADGCPDLDNDADRILDVNDGCRNDPEVYNGFQDDDGCPDRSILEESGNEIIFFEKIQFETDSAVIRPESLRIVDALAAALSGNPRVTLVEIQGHADERGSDEYNVGLTRDRSASVLEALVQRGVERRRMRSNGYGERCPIDPRSNEAAWEQNRRVEVKMLATEDGPTGVEIICPAGRTLMRQ